MEKISLAKSPFMCLSHLDKIKWKELVRLPPYDVPAFDLGLSCHSSGDGQGFSLACKMLSSIPVAGSYWKVGLAF